MHSLFTKYPDDRCNLSERHIAIGESGITIDKPGLAAHRVLSVFGGEKEIHCKYPEGVSK